MEFSIEKSVILDAVSRLSKIVSAKSYNPINYNILISSKKNNITLVAVSPEITLFLNCPAVIKHDGETTVNAKKFLNIISAFPDGKISVKSDEKEEIEINCEKNKPNFKIVGINCEEFAFNFREEYEKNVNYYDINRDSFIKMISKIIWSISSNDSQPALMGGFLETSESNEMSIVSSNGFCITIFRLPSIGLTEKILIPSKGLIEIVDFLKVSKEKVKFGVGKGFCIIFNGEDYLRINLIEQEFPSYKDVLKKLGGETEIIVDKIQIEEALFRSSIMCDKTRPSVKISFQKGIANIFSKQNDEICGEVEDEIETNYKGETIEIILDINILLNSISMVDEDKICIGVKDSSSAIFVCGEKTDDYFCMIMPLSF
jgi:DNA polymerase-3 subunit beta